MDTQKTIEHLDKFKDLRKEFLVLRVTESNLEYALNEMDKRGYLPKTYLDHFSKNYVTIIFEYVDG